MDLTRFKGAKWRKSTRSNDQGLCVEVASLPGVVGVRDSKQGDRGPILAFGTEAWGHFIQGATTNRLVTTS